ncbi:hypothetical protein, partial [Pseudodesulfovibrio pelocollis]|uniref:hypothetical protein n=1 Tax=Pseudodesulfovibrio pelocollis TaxID=3051432 RepID=UPI00255AA5A2
MDEISQFVNARRKTDSCLLLWEKERKRERERERESRRCRSSKFGIALPAGFFFGWAAPKKNQKSSAYELGRRTL